MIKGKAHNALASRGRQSFRRNDLPNSSLETNTKPPIMVMEQQQFTIFLSKVETLIAAVQNFQEAMLNN